MKNYLCKLDIEFSIPDYLETAINDYVYALRNKKYCDCEATELSLCLRDAVKFNKITEEQKKILIERINEKEEHK